MELCDCMDCPKEHIRMSCEDWIVEKYFSQKEVKICMTGLGANPCPPLFPHPTICISTHTIEMLDAVLGDVASPP